MDPVRVRLIRDRTKCEGHPSDIAFHTSIRFFVFFVVQVNNSHASRKATNVKNTGWVPSSV